MKSPTLLVVPFAAYLTQTVIAQDDLDLLYACEGLTVDPETGVLFGDCRSGENSAMTSVDLDKCLGWGAPVDYGQSYHAMHDSPRNALAPVENGNFTRNCGPCYLIERDERGQTAAQLMCSCSPEGSDFKTEYSLDLTDVVRVTDNGCLECMGVRGDCAPEVSLDQSRNLFDPGDLDRDGFNDVEELLDWLGLRAEAERTPCEDQILKHPRLLPKTFQNTTHHRCKADHSLCCYQTYGGVYGPGCATRFDAFLLIEGNNYWYRMHYAINFITLEVESLSKVTQLCEYPGQCNEESPPDDLPGLINCTYNPLETLEGLVYDNGTEAISSGSQVTFTITAPISERTAERAVERALPKPTSAASRKMTKYKTKTKSKTKKQTNRRPGQSQRILTSTRTS